MLPGPGRRRRTSRRMGGLIVPSLYQRIQQGVPQMVTRTEGPRFGQGGAGRPNRPDGSGRGHGGAGRGRGGPAQSDSAPAE